MKYLVFWLKNARLGSVENTPANRLEAFRLMHLSPIQVDFSGTEHFNVLAVRKV